MLVILSLSVFAIFILGFIVDISINLRRLNENVKKMIK